MLTNSKLPWKADANGRASLELQLKKASQINEVSTTIADAARARVRRQSLNTACRACPACSQHHVI